MLLTGKEALDNQQLFLRAICSDAAAGFKLDAIQRFQFEVLITAAILYVIMS